MKPQRPRFTPRAWESTGQTNARFLREWAAFQLELEAWRRKWATPGPEGYRLECRCGAVTAPHRDYHALINATLADGWALEVGYLGDLCPACVAYVSVSGPDGMGAGLPRAMLTRDISELARDAEFVCDGCGTNVPCRDAIGWQLGRVPPPPPNRAHLPRREPEPQDLCPGCHPGRQGVTAA